jgi:hypothetical protein
VERATTRRPLTEYSGKYVDVKKKEAVGQFAIWAYRLYDV